MFCFQCQETAKNTGCTVKGVCGKPEETANLQDLVIHVLRGIAVYERETQGIWDLGQGDRPVCGQVPFCHHHQCQLGQ